MSGSNSAERKRHEPLVLVETADLSEEDWLDYRRRGIGGSDVSAIFGTSPFRTARDLYYDKLNIASVEDDEGNWVAMEMGHLLEPLVAKIFERKTGYRVYQIKKMFQHPQYPWMLADVDYFVELPDGTTAILEIKTTNYNARDNWWMNGKETVPVYYESQGRHYMAVTDLDRCFFCCLYGNNEEEVIIREVKRDFEYEAEMVFLEQYFWENHVQRHVPPPYTESGALIIESARKHFGPADKNAPAVALDLDMTAKLMQYLRLLDEKKNAEVYSKEIDKDIQRLKALLIAEMGTSCTAVCEQEGVNYTVTYTPVRKSVIDKDMRIKGAVFCALDEGKSKRGHLYISSEELEKSALKLLNEKIPVPELRLHQQEVRDMMQEMILNGAIVSVKDNIYLPRVFAQEDETARRIAQRLVTQMPVEHIAPVLEQVKVEMGLRLSAQQEAAVYAAFRHGLSVITGSPGTGKTTVLRTILEVYRRLHPDGKIALMAPTGRASRRMSESTGFEDARTLHSGLGLTSEEDEGSRNRKSEPLSADLIIVDEFSMVDMWLAEKFFERMKANARIVLVGDPDQLPSVGAGNVFREIIETQIVPVTVLDQIFRQSKDSLIAYNAKFINEGNTKLFYGPDFVFVSGDSQEDTAEKITERYCLEIQESGIENVQILSPFRSEGAASSEQLNETIRELVNPFRSAEEEIKFGPRIFRVNDRIMQTKNTEKVSNGDLGFIRYIKDTDQGKKIGMDFGAGRTLEYGVDDLSNVDLAYATTIHKAMGSEYETVIMPLLKAHTIMMYRNLLYTGITRAKKRVVLIGQKQVLFMAIHRNEIGKRNTLLGMRIQMYFKAYAKKAGIPIPAALEEQLKNAS